MEKIKDWLNKFNQQKIENKGLLLFKRITSFLMIFGFVIFCIMISYNAGLLTDVFSIILVFPVISIIIAMLIIFFFFIIDIIFSNWLGNYDEKKAKKYDVPFFLYIFSFLPVAMLFSILTEKLKYSVLYQFDDFGLFYIFSVVTYILFLNIGMYRRLMPVSRYYYVERLEHHKKFLKIALLPVSFIVGGIGVITVFKEVDVSFKDFIYIFDSIFDNFSGSSNMIVMCFGLVIMLAIFSLPVLLIGYFFNIVFSYTLQYGYHYTAFYKSGFKIVKELTVGKKVDERNNE